MYVKRTTKQKDLVITVTIDTLNEEIIKQIPIYGRSDSIKNVDERFFIHQK